MNQKELDILVDGIVALGSLIKEKLVMSSSDQMYFEGEMEKVAELHSLVKNNPRA